jgi:hypothetical protein
MTHCPQCGANVAPGADACSACGLVVSLVRGFGGGSGHASKTIMGGVELGPLRKELPPAPKLDPTKTQPMSAPAQIARTQESMGNLVASLANTTIDDLSQTVVDPPRFQEQIVPYTLPSAGSGEAGSPVSTTLMGGARAPNGAGGPPSAGLAGSAPSGRTLLGVATPGIAPLHPERPKDAADKPARDVGPMAELGATAVPVKAKKERADLGHVRIQIPHKPHPLAKAIRGHAGAKAPKASGSRKAKAIGLLVAAMVLIVGGVLTAVLWPSAPPLTMQIVSRDGVEKMAFTCASCPDGTILRANGGEATVQGGRAEAASSAPLPVGDTQVRVEIDRPAKGRDEVVSATARVVFRVKLDLSTLAGQNPSISAVVEARPGARVTIDGALVELNGGVAIRTVDVSAELTGASLDVATLTRKIPYTIEPKDAPAESGVLTAQMQVVPLRVDAPGPMIVIDTTTFVLAGRTAPGAEVGVAGHPIAVKPDGSFAHVMSVSSTGATQIEVRASMPGRAPRLAKVAVERVASMVDAAKQFRAKNPLTLTAVSIDPGSSRGKPIVVSGEILEVRRVPYQTIAIVNVDDGCKSSCLVRVVVGSDADLKQGAHATFYGLVAGAFASSTGPAIPEIDAAFYENDAKKPDPFGSRF